jgi:hypothetical protein
MTNKPNAAVTGRGARGTEQLGKADGPRVAHRVNHEQACQHCGEKFPIAKRPGTRPIYCSAKCKQAAFRNRKWLDQYGLPDPLRVKSKTTAVSNTCTGTFRGRGIDLGGLEAALRRRILESELPHLRCVRIGDAST